MDGRTEDHSCELHALRIVGIALFPTGPSIFHETFHKMTLVFMLKRISAVHDNGRSRSLGAVSSGMSLLNSLVSFQRSRVRDSESCALAQSLLPPRKRTATRRVPTELPPVDITDIALEQHRTPVERLPPELFVT
ncbi:hypothetical protein J6590_043100 [Homalodisca vitripennis]|nr:hypothetical protein J6590_043100 [Homalodisca vitripennis]